MRSGCWTALYLCMKHHWVMTEFFFFFQAEDGIRDLTVTGVQTCALPILDLPGTFGPAHGERPGGRRAGPDTGHRGGPGLRAGGGAPLAGAADGRAVGARGADRAALVDRGHAGDPVGVRAGDGVLLPVAAAGGGARRRPAGLVTSLPGRGHRRGAHVLLSGPVA